MKTLLLTLLIPTITFGQTWAPLGAKWTYTQPTVNPNYTTYTTFESVADTVISGQSCKKITEVHHNSPTTADTFQHFMYSDSNRVYFQASGSWNLLYDFNVQQGDSFLVGHYNQWVKIVSVDTVTINGFSRKRFEYDAPSFTSEFSWIVIEGIGHMIDMFPTYDNQLFGPLRCYQDNVVGLYKSEYYYGSTWNQDCDQIITGIDEPFDSKKVIVFPNPFADQVTFSLAINGQTIIFLYDFLGQQVLQQAFTTTTTINTEKLADGIYFYELRNDKGAVKNGKVLKQ